MPGLVPGIFVDASLFHAVIPVPGLDPGISPGHPDRAGAAAAKVGERGGSPIGITGTRPVMTRVGVGLPERTGGEGRGRLILHAIPFPRCARRSDPKDRRDDTKLQAQRHTFGVIPGRSEAEGKGIHTAASQKAPRVSLPLVGRDRVGV